MWKIERLITLKKKLKNNFKKYGRYTLKVKTFFLVSLLNLNQIIYRTSHITNDDRQEVN